MICSSLPLPIAKLVLSRRRHFEFRSEPIILHTTGIAAAKMEPFLSIETACLGTISECVLISFATCGLLLKHERARNRSFRFGVKLFDNVRFGAKGYARFPDISLQDAKFVETRSSVWSICNDRSMSSFSYYIKCYVKRFVRQFSLMSI